MLAGQDGAAARAPAPFTASGRMQQLVPTSTVRPWLLNGDWIRCEARRFSDWAR